MALSWARSSRGPSPIPLSELVICPGDLLSPVCLIVGCQAPTCSEAGPSPLLLYHGPFLLCAACHTHAHPKPWLMLFSTRLSLYLNTTSSPGSAHLVPLHKLRRPQHKVQFRLFVSRLIPSNLLSAFYLTFI